MKEFQLQNSASVYTKQEVLRKTKKDVKLMLGLCYNDINSHVWMYRLKSAKRLLGYRFLYIVFINNCANSIHFTRYKTDRFFNIPS